MVLNSGGFKGPEFHSRNTHSHLHTYIHTHINMHGHMHTYTHTRSNSQATISGYIRIFEVKEELN